MILLIEFIFEYYNTIQKEMQSFFRFPFTV